MKDTHVMSGDLWAAAESQMYALAKALQRNHDCTVSVLLFHEGMLARAAQSGRVISLINEKVAGDRVA